jgi:hypothetical protein
MIQGDGSAMPSSDRRSVGTLFSVIDGHDTARILAAHGKPDQG